MRYVAVFRHSFADSGHFSQEELDVDTEEQAYQVAQAKAYRMHEMFSRCSVTLVALKENETLVPIESGIPAAIGLGILIGASLASLIVWLSF